MQLNNSEKRRLKADAQRLEPILKLGKNGVSAGFLQSLETALAQKSLVKIKFADFKDQRKELSREIAEKTASELIMLVGNVAVFFRAGAVEN